MYLGGPRAHDRFNHVLDVLDYAMQGRTGVSLGASPAAAGQDTSGLVLCAAAGSAAAIKTPSVAAQS